MKIYILGCRGVPARYGGFETLAERLLDGLSQRGHTVEVIGTRDEHVRRSLSGRIVQFRPLRALETPLLTWMSRPDPTPMDRILVLNPINVWTAKRLARSGARVWLHMDGMEHKRRKWGWLARLAHRTARRVATRSSLGLIVDSHAIGHILRDELGAATHYIGYGGCLIAEHDAQHRWSPTSPHSNFLCVARPEPENNLLEICRAFNNARTDLTLTVIGAPDRPTSYWRLVEAEARRNSAIHLFPAIWDRKNLCQLYVNCRAVVHGHSAGGTNPALVDALSHGVPVFAHDNPFNRETIGSSGRFWIDEDALTQFFDDPNTEREPGEWWTMSELLNWSKVVEDYQRILT